MLKTLIVQLMILASVFTTVQRSLASPLEEQEDVDQHLIKKIKKLSAKSINDLVHLAPFSDVVVIQRRFMPKTGRVSFSGSANFVLSSEFFLNPGLEAHIAYFFLEKHGVELSTYYVLSFDRQITNDFKRIKLDINEANPIAQAFVGVTYKWMPVYGKISFYNKKILSFDTILNIGGGMSALSVKNSQQQTVWEPTIVAGIGQVFAITRNLGFRWDLRWHFTFRLTTNPLSGFLNDFPLSMGISYYYPSAGSR